MLPVIILVIAIAIAVIFWAIYTQRRLVMLDENIGHSMNMIGVQLSNQFDALTFLAEVMKEYTESESDALALIIRSQRRMITAKSSADDVLRQEGVISKALDRIAVISEQYPELKSDRNYIRAMNAIQAMESMIRTSRMVYNGSVTKLNRKIRMLPTSVIAGILGLLPRDYLQ